MYILPWYHSIVGYLAPIRAVHMQEALKYRRAEVLTPTAQPRAWTPSLGHQQLDTLAKSYVTSAQTKHVC